MIEIAKALGVSKSSVSLWTSDVEFDDVAWSARVEARRRDTASARRRSTLSLRREQEIERARVTGVAEIGTISDR